MMPTPSLLSVEVVIKSNLKAMDANTKQDGEHVASIIDLKSSTDKSPPPQDATTSKVQPQPQALSGASSYPSSDDGFELIERNAVDRASLLSDSHQDPYQRRLHLQLAIP